MSHSKGLVLLCDSQGLIVQVLRNDLGLDKAAPNQLFFELVESTSREKAVNFLNELRSQRAVLDWEMNVSGNGRIFALHFAGGSAGDSLLITAATDSQLTERLYDDLLRMNNEQTNMLRAAMKDKLGSSHSIPDSMYDEISRLNNELVSMQRKLAGKNAELKQKIEERTRELREAQEQLIRQEKLAVLGQMAGSVGHELRNPLAVINNALYYLKLVQPDADMKVKEYLDIIQTETHTAEKIITDLLDFARIKSADVEVVSVSELIQQTLERFPAPPSVEVTLEIPSDLPQIFVDPRQMTQVLGNLTVNAYQAMPEGGQLLVTSRIEGSVIGKQLSVNSDTSTAPSTSQWVLITVKDTGMGIPPENMKKLFEPLFTTKTKGIGLGLAVSQKLAEANGGRIEAASEAGKGSTFTLVLPVHKG